MAILAAMTVADWAPEQLAQAEADELSPRWFTPPCLRPRPAWRAGKSSVEMNAKPISAQVSEHAPASCRTASDTNAR
jgi:hypothetical protein